MHHCQFLRINDSERSKKKSIEKNQCALLGNQGMQG